ncbi:MAG: DUF3800 domain-containing protein [Bacteroidales bacterium]
MNNQLAFIDEYGNFGFDFDKEGVSTHFIVTAIIVDFDSLHQCELLLENVRKTEFQTGEIKSSSVGKDTNRRLRILKELIKIDFHVFSVVIDKRKLTGEGFKFKQPFYKFLHSLVDRELFKVFPDLKIVADEHGSKEFMDGFIKYIGNNHIPNLFNQSDFRFSNSKSDLVVQLADFITGTLSLCYDEKRLSDYRSDFLTVIKDKLIKIRFWPKDYFPYSYEPQKDFQEFDLTISTLGVNMAKQVLNDNENSSGPADIDQVNCLRYLLFYFQNINPTRYVSTHELMRHINSWRENDISIHYFRSKIIAKLRDRGVIVASCNLGYKLPSNHNDLYDYVNHTNAYLQPMIDRLLKCRDKVKLATKNNIDILDHDEFVYLKKLINNNLP